MARTARRYEKRTEKKSYQIPVYMAAIYARLSVDTDERKSESIETQVTLIKEFNDRTDNGNECQVKISIRFLAGPFCHPTGDSKSC